MPNYCREGPDDCRNNGRAAFQAMISATFQEVALAVRPSMWVTTVLGCRRSAPFACSSAIGAKKHPEGRLVRGYAREGGGTDYPIELSTDIS